jgi:hypothetical protein
MIQMLIGQLVLLTETHRAFWYQETKQLSGEDWEGSVQDCWTSLLGHVIVLRKQRVHDETFYDLIVRHRLGATETFGTDELPELPEYFADMVGWSRAFCPIQNILDETAGLLVQAGY